MPLHESHPTDRGLWSTPGFPHRGWEISGSMDRGVDMLETCEACQSAQVRYAIILSHADWREDIEVGCYCAEALTQDRTRPKKIEKAMHNRRNRRASFPSLKSWKKSKAGRPWIERQGHRIVLIQDGHAWLYVLDGVTHQWLYRSRDEAALAAYDRAWPLV